MSAAGQPDTALEPDDHRLQPLQRLMASRARLRATLIPSDRYGASGKRPGAGGSLVRRARAVWRLIVSRSAGGAVFSTAASLLRNWWVRQPWHATTELLSHAVAREVSPWVKRNPVTAVALGACAGAALAAARPWRWQAVSSQRRLMSRSVGRWAVSQLTQAPVQMALAAAVAAWLEKRHPPDAHGSQPASRTNAASDSAVHPGPNQAGETRPP
jgi:hypothetical protein